MKPENETCIQTVTFSFSVLGREPELFAKAIGQGNNPPPAESIRLFGNRLNERINSIAVMVEILCSLQPHWSFATNKDKLIMVCEDLDFNRALTLLKERGFTEKDFSFSVEYTRKWGFL